MRRCGNDGFACSVRLGDHRAGKRFCAQLLRDHAFHQAEANGFGRLGCAHLDVAVMRASDGDEQRQRFGQKLIQVFAGSELQELHEHVALVRDALEDIVR